MKNTKIKLAGILLGAALASTGAYAGNSSCGAGKCGADMKKVDKMDKSAHTMKKDGMKKADGSCGAGKCGADMKKDSMKKDTMKKDGMKKVEGSCGAGKCG